MADTMIFALIGSLIVTLTLLPVLCAWFMRSGVRERRNRVFEAIRSAYVTRPGFLPRASAGGRLVASALLLARSLLLIPGDRRRVHAAAGRGRAVGARDHALHDLVRRGGEDRAAGARDIALLSRGHDGRLGAGPARRRHRSHRLLQRRVLRRPQALFAVARRLSRQGGPDRGDRTASSRPSPASTSTTPSPPRTRSTRRRPA